MKPRRLKKKKKGLGAIKWRLRRHWSRISTDSNTDVLIDVLKEQLQCADHVLI